MKRTTKIAAAVGVALSLGLAAAVVNANPYGMGWGGGPESCWGSGYGPGAGYGMRGYGMGPGYGPGAGYGMHGYGMGPGYGPGPGYGGMHGYGMGYGAGPQGMHGAYPGSADEGLAGLKVELGIDAKQESAWQAYVDSVKQQEKDKQAWFAKMRDARAAGSAPELLAQQTEVMKQRQAELEAASTALKTLYAVLTPEQKAIADQRIGGFGPRYGAGYGRGYSGRAR